MSSTAHLITNAERNNSNYESVSDSDEEAVSTLAEVRRAYGPKEDRRILKNLFGVAIPFVLLFSAISPVHSIQSSLNGKDGLGPYSLAATYIAGSISSLFFLSFLLSKVTSKMAMVLSILTAQVYVLAQFYPTFATLVPTSVLLGIGLGVLWTSASNYISRISQEYAYITGTDYDLVLARFFGIFFVLYHSSGIWGNLVLAGTMAHDGGTGNYTNATCGAGLCPASHGNTTMSQAEILETTPQSTLDLVFGSYFVCVLIAALIMVFFVDPLSRYGEGCPGQEQHESSADLLCSTVKQMMNPYQLLLIPFLFFSTFQVGFFASDFTAGYITCAWGMEHVGEIMLVFHVSASISSFLFSRLIKYIRRLGVFTFITIAHLAADVMMLHWIPDESQPYGFFVIACITGLVEGVLSAQIVAFLALIFQEKKEAAFNNQRLWQSVGFIVAYINTTLLCMTTKLYLMVVMSVIGFVGYFIVEICYSRKASMTTTS